MTEQEKRCVEKNITLSFEFERYVLEHPEILDQIPNKADVVLLPKDDPDLYRMNLEAARRRHSDGHQQPVVYIEIEALEPIRSRVRNPKVTQTPPSLQPAMV